MTEKNMIRMSGHKANRAVDERIERLGQLNDRRIAANAAGDIGELEAVAMEYEKLNMLTTAKEIRIALSVRKNEVKHERMESNTL